jgi:Ca-activated chloride channel family protein
MTFASPQVLWLLLAPLALLIWELSQRRRVRTLATRPKILRAEVAEGDLHLVRDPARVANARVRPWLAAGLVFAVLALARPQWGRIEEPVFDQSREILLAVDLSRSMLSPDVKPTRLDRAKLLIQSLLEKLQGERVGLVVFSGTAFLQSPLSADYEILREFLPSLAPDFLPEGGTNYRALIDTSLDAFGASASADRFLIVLSDGEATDDSWRSRVDELKKHGIRVIGLGVGTSGGSMIPDGSGGFVKDERGAVVMSKLEPATLQELAKETNGTYRDASSWIDLASLVQETVNAGRKGAFTETNTVRYVERFQWPLALALWCLLISFYYELPVQPKPRDIALRGAKRPATAPAPNAAPPLLALLIGLSLALDWPAPRASAAVKLAPPSAAPKSPAPTASAPNAPAAASAPAPGQPAPDANVLGRTIGRLADKPALTAPDYSEIAHETLTWGRGLKDAGQTVPPGPVKDALQAVDQLEAAGDKLADWKELRKQLEDLLKNPEQKQQQNQQQQNQDDKKDQKSGDQKDQKQSQKQQDDSKKGGQQNDSQKSDPSSKQDQKSGDPKDQKEQKDEKGQNGQNPEDSKSNPAKSSPQQPAFGDMKQQQPQPPPPAAPGETQKVGGAQEPKPAAANGDPTLAIPLQKLDQLKNQDSPGELFKLMKEERGAASPKKPAKDW